MAEVHNQSQPLPMAVRMDREQNYNVGLEIKIMFYTFTIQMAARERP